MSEGDDHHRKKRSLILAGGGIKVAFQAGVLQVWLDEAGLTFDHADGASGGTFNLAMYCQGMSGARIADNWRDLSPHVGVDFNLAEYGKLVLRRVAVHAGPVQGEGLPGVGAGLGPYPRLGAGGHLQRLQLQQARAGGADPRQDDRRLPGRLRLAPDVVPAGDHRRRHLHRPGLYHRR